MKIKNIQLALISTIITFLIFSCKKDAVIADSPLLSISIPTAWQSVTGGSSVHIMGTATASAADDIHLLHELNITVKRQSNNRTVWTADISTHDLNSYSIDTSFIAPAGISDSLILTAQVSNHIPKITTRSVTFFVHP